MSRVRGPNSALTEFLRERGISAADIRERAARTADVRAQITAEREESALTATPQTNTPGARRTPETHASRSAQLETPVVDAQSSAAGGDNVRFAVSNKGKGKAKGKKRKRAEGETDEEADADFNPYAKSIPTPGQIAFCAECDSRFTVTAYSKASPDGDGLLCTACGRKTAKVDQEVKKKRAANKKVKRDVARAALDGKARGARSLKDLAIMAIAKSIGRYEALGPLHEHDVDRLCQIISRNRSLTDETLKLFTVTGNSTLTLYDCAKISAEALCMIAADMPELTHLSLFHAGQANDEVLDYYAKNLPHLSSFHLRGSFLVSRQALTDFITQVGPRLKSLTIGSTARTSPAVFEAIVTHCSSLEELSVNNLSRFDSECLRLLGGLSTLKSLDVSFAGAELTDDAMVDVLNTIGSGLEELNISGNPLLGARTTQAIHACCASLRVLNINELELLADQDIVDLFSNWPKNKGLTELHMARVINLEDSGAFALASHSGQRLETLNINSCGDVTMDGLMMVLRTCKKLSKFDTAFIRDVNDEAVEMMQTGGIKTLAVWGCPRVTECVKIQPDAVMVGRESDITA